MIDNKTERVVELVKHKIAQSGSLMSYELGRTEQQGEWLYVDIKLYEGVSQAYDIRRLRINDNDEIEIQMRKDEWETINEEIGAIQ